MERRIIGFILQIIYLEFEEILEGYENLLKEYKNLKKYLIVGREVNLNYLKMLLIEINPEFASVMNVYIISIEKEVCNIKNLRESRNTSENLYSSFDIEKRYNIVKNLVKKMKEYDNNPKTSKTIEGYYKYYKIILNDYQREVKNCIL